MTELKPFERATVGAVPATPSADIANHLDALLRTVPSLTGRIEAIVSTLPHRAAFSTSLGLEDQAILHAIATIGAAVDIFTLDTGRHFPETLASIAESEKRYGLRIRVVAPDAKALETLVARDGVFGFRSSLNARKACCNVRKVQPLDRELADASTWITGLRRGQSSDRTETPFATFDAQRRLVKANPIADWDLAAVEAYVTEHDIPVNALHARGFPSIGCEPCTRAVRPGDDIRAGRWWWESASGKECGLHCAETRQDETTS